MRSPILLSSTVLVQPGGVVEVPNTSNLQNPFRTPMLIDEIRFDASSAGVGSQTSYFAIRVELKLGRTPLTNGYVAIGLLGKALNPIIDQQVSTPSQQGFTWKLPKPLYVPATEFLNAKFYFAPDFSVAPDPQPVTISYVGRSLAADDKVPDKVMIPWVTAYNSPIIPVVVPGSDLTLSSTPSDLVNPFNEPLVVQRFLSRYFGANMNYDNVDPVYDLNTTARVFDSKGGIIVRDPIPLNLLMDFTTRSWTMNGRLQPKGYYTFKFGLNFSQATVADPTTAFSVSMVGYREVQYT